MHFYQNDKTTTVGRVPKGSNFEDQAFPLWCLDSLALDIPAELSQPRDEVKAHQQIDIATSLLPGPA